MILENGFDLSSKLRPIFLLLQILLVLESGPSEYCLVHLKILSLWDVNYTPDGIHTHKAIEIMHLRHNFQLKCSISVVLCVFIQS